MYRNPKAINVIGRTCYPLMMALYSVELVSPLGQRLMKAFPECFTEEKSEGPIPLSVLSAKIASIGREEMLLVEIFGRHAGTAPLLPVDYLFWKIYKGNRKQKLPVDAPNWRIKVGERHFVGKDEYVTIFNHNSSECSRIFMVPAGSVDTTL